MNFDPDDSLMAHAFGLPAESGLAGFSEPREELTAAELDRVCAVIAVSSVAPVAPAARSLPAIRARLNLPVRRPWRGISSWTGWGIAAGLAGLMAVNGLRPDDRPVTAASPDSIPSGVSPDTDSGPAPAVAQAPRRAMTPDAAGDEADPRPEPSGATEPAADSAFAAQAGRRDAAAPEETIAGDDDSDALLAEIDDLRYRLARAQESSIAEHVPSVAGVAWPVVIEMRPPGSLESTGGQPLVSRIADLLTDIPSAARTPAADENAAPGPAGIQIYDPARNAGTLTFRNLPPAPAGMQYSLWITAAGSNVPTYVGALPRDIASSDAVDFTLGTTGIVPAGISVWLSPEAAGTMAAPGDTAASEPVPSLDTADAVMVLQGP